MSNTAYIINTDKALLNIDMIHDYLCNESYWSKGIPRSIVEKSIAHSLCFGVYWQEEQVAFARVISDCATFAYLCDVFVVSPHRGKGISKQLMQYIMAYPELQNLRRWVLLTADAHGLYKQFNWVTPAMPDRYMEVHTKDIYMSIKDK